MLRIAIILRSKLPHCVNYAIQWAIICVIFDFVIGKCMYITISLVALPFNLQLVQYSKTHQQRNTTSQVGRKSVVYTLTIGSFCNVKTAAACTRKALTNYKIRLELLHQIHSRAETVFYHIIFDLMKVEFDVPW